MGSGFGGWGGGVSPDNNPISAFIEARRNRDQKALEQKSRTLEFMQHVADNVSPEYHDQLIGMMADTEALGGSKADRQKLADNLRQISQLSKGIGAVTKSTDFAPTDTTAPNQASPMFSTPTSPSGPIASMANSLGTTDRSAGQPQSGSQGADPITMMLRSGAPSATPSRYPGYAPPQLNPSQSDDPNQPGPVAPTSYGGTSLVGQSLQRPFYNTPVENPTGQIPGATATSKVPLIEDPIARKLREQQALQPGELEKYQTMQNTLYGNRSRLLDQGTQAKLTLEQKTYQDKLTNMLQGIGAKEQAQMTLKSNLDFNTNYNALINAGVDPVSAAQQASQLVVGKTQSLIGQRQEHAQYFSNRIDLMGKALDLQRQKLAAETASKTATATDRVNQQNTDRQLKIYESQVNALKSAQKSLESSSYYSQSFDDAEVAKGGVAKNLADRRAAIQKKQDDLEDKINGLTPVEATPQTPGTPPAAGPKTSGHAGPRTPTGGGVQIGDLIMQDGKQYRVTGFDPQGKPKGKLVQ